MNRKKFTLTGRFFTVAGRNLLTQKEIYYQRTTFDVTRKKIGINFVELGIISPQKMNFLPKKEVYCHWKKFTVTGRNLVSQEEM